MPDTATRNPQSMEALSAANEARSKRARLKRDVRLGSVDVRDLIRNPPEILRTNPAAKHPCTVVNLLTWQPRWGVDRARKLLQPYCVGPYTTPFDLTPARREQIARALG